MTEPLLRVEELALLLNVKPSTVYEWARMKYIPHVKIGACLRFDRAAVEKWLKARREEGRTKRVPA